MKTVEMNMWQRLDKLGYDGIGIVQATDNLTGEQTLQIVRRKEFEAEHPECHVCPTYEMIAEWLRKEKDIVIVVKPHQVMMSDTLIYLGFAYKIHTYGDNRKRLLKPLECINDDYDKTLEDIINKALAELEKDIAE